MVSRRQKRELHNAELPLQQRKRIPHEFVLEALAELQPRTNPMFGCLAIYVGEKIVLILRDKPTHPADNGVWLATTNEHHESLLKDLPNMRSIGLLGKKITGWQVLPAQSHSFEADALRACELVLAGDPRIGKISNAKRAGKANPLRPAKPEGILGKKNNRRKR